MTHVNFLTAQLKYKTPPIPVGAKILICTRPAVWYFYVYSSVLVLNTNTKSRPVFKEFK